MNPFVRSSTSPEREGYSRIGINGHNNRRMYPSHLIASVALIVCVLLLATALVTVFAVRTTFKTLHHYHQNILNRSDLAATSPILLINETSTKRYHESPLILNVDFERAYRKARKDVLSEEAELEKNYAMMINNCYENETPLSASVFHQFLNFDVTNGCNESSVDEGKIRERAARIIKEWFHLNRSQMGAVLRINNTDRDDGWCSTKPIQSCNETYRSYDGSCNNLLRTSWGAARTTYRRVLYPDYADGISEPRISFDGVHSLPNARVVSSKLHLDAKLVGDHKHSSLMTFFGEFVAHDISKVAPASSASSVSFCRTPQTDRYPINVTSDPFYSSLNVTRLSFIRSRDGLQSDCLGPRQQMNLVTSYLDGSVIYGSSKEESVSLRTANGQLKSSTSDKQMFLPVQESNSSFCAFTAFNKSCVLAGDSRCNENILLASLHTVWLREHNRIGAALGELNPSWSDDRVFEESRRLVVAELQHITYREYLPKLLGATSLETNGYYNNYSVDVNPTIGNEFATAAFRFGHSTINGLLQVVDSDGIEHVQLSKTLFTSATIKRERGFLSGWLRGAAEQISRSVGLHYNKQLRNRLFQGKGAGAGLDLAAIDIQRGRDHGIPSYNLFRRFCGLSELNTHEDLKKVFGIQMAEKFLEVYNNVEDIDLISGGLAEPHVAGGTLGPTFACLVDDQFSRLRGGDRHWYENRPGVAPIPFTKEQLAEIRKASLARIICDNVPEIKNLQPDVFLVPFERNSPVSCLSNKIPKVDIVYWYEADENYEDDYEDDETEE